MFTACENMDLMETQGPQGEQGETGLQGEPGEEGLDSNTCVMPYNTIIMQYEWGQAETWRHSCINTADTSYKDCIQTAKFNHHGCLDHHWNGEEEEKHQGCLDNLYIQKSACEDNLQDDENICRKWHAKRVNKIPLRVCGTRIFDNSNGGLPENEDGDLEYIMMDEEDFDGDGISNWYEFLMGYNPCSSKSFGSCIDDATLDYDADGIPNWEDPYPLCNMEDPGEYHSDCV